MSICFLPPHLPLFCGPQVLDFISDLCYLIFQTLQKGGKGEKMTLEATKEGRFLLSIYKRTSG